MCTSNNSIDCIVIDTSEQTLPFSSLGHGRNITKYTHRPVQYTTEMASENCVQLLFTEKKRKKSVTESDV